MISDVQLAWAAGIIDGEGCLHISRARPNRGAGAVSPSYSFYLKVTMGHRPTVERLQSIFAAAGCPGSIQSVTQWRFNPAYSWLLASRKAIDVIRLVRPYLVTKAAEADIAEEFMSLRPAPRGGNNKFRATPPELLAERHALWDKMRRAKPSFRFREAVA